MSKYHSVKTKCNHGHLHDSKKEKNRCDELHLLLKNGNITNLKVQVRMKLQTAFKAQGVAVRGIFYVADFTYYDVDEKKFVIEDTKGYRTAVYKLKKKLLLFIMKYKHDFKFLES